MSTRQKKTLHLLILEDSPDDAELAVKELEREGFMVEWSRVETEKAFREAIDKTPNLILVDYDLPSFDGMSALKVQQEITPEIPLIIISGKIGEEVAVDSIKSGATDYVLKDRLFRLGPVIKRALEEAKAYRERKRAEEALQRAHDEMERRVEERTADLRITNEKLRREITERKKAEEALRKAHAQNEHLLASISSILISIDENNRITQWNRVAERTFGITAKDVVRQTFRECSIQWEWTSIIEGISVCCREKRPVRLDEIRFTRADGKEGFLGITLNPIIGKKHEQPGVLLLGRDITEYRWAQEELKLAYAQLNRIFNAAGDGMCVIDKNFNTLRVNDTFLNLANINKDEAIGKKCYEVFPCPQCRTPHCPLIQILDGKEYVEIVVEKECNDGTKIPCILTATPLRESHEGKLIGIVEELKDIT